MRSLTNKETVLRETICPKCGRKFKTIKEGGKPNCFYCELKKYPPPPDLDYRDVAAARLESGTYTKEQEDIYWTEVCKGDPKPQFSGFPEEFDVPREDMKIELVPLTRIPWSGTIEEFEEALQEWFGSFLSVSKVVYNKEEDIIILVVPDFIKGPDNPVLWLNLDYIGRFFASITEAIAKKIGGEVRFGIHFPKYPRFDFQGAGYWPKAEV